MRLGLVARHGPIKRHLIRSTSSRTSRTRVPWRNPRQQLHQRQHLLLFSQTTYQDPTLLWAQSNPRLAQECLNPPPTTYNVGPSAENNIKSLETYLEWRGWKFPNEISDQSQSRTFEDPRENAKALISHLLSAPLTLASQAKNVGKNCVNNDIKEGKFDWCCVGARAEASIPIMYWKEFLMATRVSLFSDKDYSSKTSLEISLDFIGPDIPPKLSEQTVIVPESDDENAPFATSLSLRGYYRGYFHDIPAVKAANPNTKSWDAYIFFNPGFGHPNLRKSWESTLELLLDRGQTSTRRKPCALLLTAHSEHDMHRDAELLRSVYDIEDVEYHENPFASRVAYEDPFEKSHFVRPNHYVATVLI